MSSESSPRSIKIFLVEDNEGDIFLTKKAFEKAKISNSIQVAKDGEEAVEKLIEICENSRESLPDIIFLDINLPKKDGKEVLYEIKNHPDLKRIPVVILTSSEAEKDILKSYDLQANSYIIKPINLEKFNTVVSTLEDFWFSIVSLPPHTSDKEKQAS